MAAAQKAQKARKLDKKVPNLNVKCKVQNAKYRLKLNIMMKSHPAESVGMTFILKKYVDKVKSLSTIVNTVVNTKTPYS